MPDEPLIPSSLEDLLRRPLLSHLATLHPQVAISINDPEAPYRYLEVRGRVVRIDPDPDAAFFGVLARRYGLTMDGPLEDAPDRVVLVAPTAVSCQ